MPLSRRVVVNRMRQERIEEQKVKKIAEERAAKVAIEAMALLISAKG